MSSPIDPTVFRKYMAATFPCVRLDSYPIGFGDVYLRFELGGDHPSGSDERITQAMERSVSLFQECNGVDDDMVLIIKDWGVSGEEALLSEPSGYLYSLIRGFHKKEAFVEIIDGDEYCDSYRQFLYATTFRDLDYSGILKGITHLEQGRTPRINEVVYFINKANNTVFYMYDDRGCLVYSDVPDKLHRLYSQRNDWLVDYDRAHFDAVFG